METGAFALDLPPSSVNAPLLQSKVILTAFNEMSSTAPDSDIYKEREVDTQKGRKATCEVQTLQSTGSSRPHSPTPKGKCNRRCLTTTAIKPPPNSSMPETLPEAKPSSRNTSFPNT
jgi:hypothetical protein